VAKTAALVMPDGTLHFFNGRDHVGPDSAHPGPIAVSWPALAEAGFDDGVDAAVAWPDGGVYFFSGSEYVRYDPASDRLDSCPREIDTGWPGVFDKDIDAVLPPAVGTDGTAYFFRGAEYLAVAPAADGTAVGDAVGGVRLIADGWPGVFDADLDSVSVLADGLAYFVRGRRFVRYDPAAGRVVDAEPRPLGDGFPDAFGGVAPRAGELPPLRRAAVDLARSAASGEPGDAVFDEVVGGWNGRGSAGALLCHWLLDRIGCTDPTLVNRGAFHVEGRDIAKLYHGGVAPFVRWTPGARPRPGDLVFLRGATDHLLVFVSEEFTADGTVWHTVETDRDAHGRQVVRTGRRRPLVASGALRLSGDTPERTVIGWVDLDLLGLDGPAVPGEVDR
jgi:hypothetical protein